MNKRFFSFSYFDDKKRFFEICFDRQLKDFAAVFSDDKNFIWGNQLVIYKILKKMDPDFMTIDYCWMMLFLFLLQNGEKKYSLETFKRNAYDMLCFELDEIDFMLGKLHQNKYICLSKKNIGLSKKMYRLFDKNIFNMYIDLAVSNHSYANNLSTETFDYVRNQIMGKNTLFFEGPLSTETVNIVLQQEYDYITIDAYLFRKGSTLIDLIEYFCTTTCDYVLFIENISKYYWPLELYPKILNLCQTYGRKVIFTKTNVLDLIEFPLDVQMDFYTVTPFSVLLRI